MTRLHILNVALACVFLAACSATPKRAAIIVPEMEPEYLRALVNNGTLSERDFLLAPPVRGSAVGYDNKYFYALGFPYRIDIGQGYCVHAKVANPLATVDELLEALRSGQSVEYNYFKVFLKSD